MTHSRRDVRDVLRRTVLFTPSRLATRLQVDLAIATETFQHTGSFKFRAAYNLAAQVEADTILTASSGNFGQALAYACRLLNKRAIVVMPHTSARVKVEAVKEHGAVVELVDVNVKSRAERVTELARANPEAFVASAYDDPRVIAGNATLGEELSTLGFDTVVVPVGGGGLSSGVVRGLRESGNTDTRVVGAEPLLGNDAARSLRAGRIVRNETEPRTIADGARTLSLGGHNWAILERGIETIVEVPENLISEAVRLLFELANLKAEPTGALSIGALLTEPERFRAGRICCVVSGGNVDPDVYRQILAREL
ncbi:MAG TPA: pyridoxal-phosphate dependent enzyme [Vicinamibacteria bacterium]|nr:pyridoxal-phosphate dependent enzyme [Vicinamibacteria bacterium]